MNTMDRVSKIYRNRWADPRYGFATPETCPIPTCKEDLIEMDSFYMGLVLDTFMFSFISRYSWQSCRSCHFWAINHMLYWVRTADNDKAKAEQFKALIEAIQLKPMLKLNVVDGPYTDRIQDLARAAFDRVGTISSMICCQLPTTIIEQMDSLVEEMEHAT